MKKRVISLDDIKAAKCKKSLYFFVRTFWPIVEPKSKFVSNWHLKAICDHLQAVADGRIKKLLINIPPRMLKSTLVSVMFPAWRWTWDPEHRFLCSTYAQNLSRRDAVKMRRVVSSDLYTFLFGNFKFQDDQNTKDKFENDKTGCRISTAVGGIATGEGGDTIIVDDPHSAGEVNSSVKRQTVIDWWRESMSTRINDENTGARIIIMQRLHESDLSGWLLENDKEFEHLCLPLEYIQTDHQTSIGFKDPRKKEGELLFSKRMNAEQVQSKKTEMGSIGYSGQMQQSPVPAGGNIIRMQDLRFYKEIPTGIEREKLFLDMSFEGEQNSDFNVCGWMGKRGPDFFLLPDMLRIRANFPIAMGHVETFKSRHEKLGLKIEKKANGHAAIQILKKKYAGVTEYEPKVSKEERLYMVQPIFEAGNFWLPDPIVWPWVADVIKELLFFPKAAHDDIVDVITMGLLDLNSNNASSFQSVGERKYG